MTATLSSSSSIRSGSPRLASIDAFRGLVMFLMLFEALRFCEVAAAVPHSGVWQFLCVQQTHAEWAGWSLHDFIMPSFGFLVGVALPFSIAKRQARGDTVRQILQHTSIRSVVFVALGIAIASAHPRQLTWSFVDILPQVGFGYVALTILALRPRRDAWIAVVAILTGTWLAFALYRPPNLPLEAVGVSADWVRLHGLVGFAAHWQKNSNLGWLVDTWVLNVLPRSEPFLYDPGGGVTLNFVPFLATMVMGLIAGRELRSDREGNAIAARLVIAGLACVAASAAIAELGIGPIVKRLWTPSWTLFSGGVALITLAGFYLMVDLKRQRGIVFPFVVLGSNSLAVYCLSHFYSAFAFHSISRVVGVAPFRVLGTAYVPAVYGGLIVAGYWSAMYLLYRKRIFLRV